MGAGYRQVRHGIFTPVQQRNIYNLTKLCKNHADFAKAASNCFSQVESANFMQNMSGPLKGPFNTLLTIMVSHDS